jgi:hypothetical protein
MTVFALIAMAAYARFVRLAGSERIAPVITPLTPPATRNTRQEVAPRQPWGWLLVAALGTMLALGSYEQAVMMPFMMLGISLAATDVLTVRSGTASALAFSVFGVEIT